jgi:DNA polymerase elongation subunit (family B)
MTKYLVFDCETKGSRGTSEGLDPRKSRIMAISVKTSEFEKLLTYPSEKKILEEFWAIVKSENYVLVGFNCDRFDIRYLYLRSMINNVPVARIDDRCLDLRRIISAGDKYAKGTLDQLSELVGYQPNFSGFSKGAAPLLWRGDQIPELIDKLMDDSRRTYLLLEKMRGVNLI